MTNEDLLILVGVTVVAVGIAHVCGWKLSDMAKVFNFVKKERKE